MTFNKKAMIFEADIVVAGKVWGSDSLNPLMGRGYGRRGFYLRIRNGLGCRPRGQCLEGVVNFHMIGREPIAPLTILKKGTRPVGAVAPNHLPRSVCGPW